MTSTLAERVFAGDARAIARAISLIEDESPAGAGLEARGCPWWLMGAPCA